MKIVYISKIFLKNQGIKKKVKHEWNRAKQHWNEITPQYLQHVYNNIPRHVATVSRARGYPTKY